jgi:hypothetical protein
MSVKFCNAELKNNSMQCNQILEYIANLVFNQKRNLAN